MPFIIDLPPVDYQNDNTKIEHVVVNGEKNIPSVDFDVFKIDRDIFEDVYFQEKFESLVSAWKGNTVFQSSISKIIEDDNFVEMLKMNKKALLPLIINEIEREPSILVWALNIITGQSVSTKQRYTIEDVCKRWVKLYREQKINFI
ncbi:MAG: hypothetical protein CO117_12830 [Flavobacteriaceae bacterium CG_4_9_14_3_um_filter_33_16]|nr:MAG: hypothetical protein CO117_12830 [Flavobacteriaceae bacterium CG_4_9_14_3_um_filter_33_16]